MPVAIDNHIVSVAYASGSASIAHAECAERHNEFGETGGIDFAPMAISLQDHNSSAASFWTKTYDRRRLSNLIFAAITGMVSGPRFPAPANIHTSLETRSCLEN